MNWTSDKPTQEGWYWIDDPVLFGREVVHVIKRPGHSYLTIQTTGAYEKRNFIMISKLQARWTGPIPEPEEK